jgi:hypothetical protein
MVGGRQAGPSAVWPAWADVHWGEVLSLAANLVSKRAITQGFPPAIGLRLIMSNDRSGESW